VEFTAHKRLTEALVTLTDEDGVSVEALGTTLRSKGDVNFPEVGRAISYGRALQAIGALIEDDAHALTVSKEEYERVTNFQAARSLDGCPCRRG
jgi:hypothetical protein